MFRIEAFFFLHQRPGYDQEFCGKLDTHLRADPFLLRPAFELVRKVGDEILVLERGDQRRLIQTVPEIGLALLGDDRYRAVGLFTASICAQVEARHFQYLLCARKPVRIADGSKHL